MLNRTIFILIAVILYAPVLWASSKERISYRVICDNQAVLEKISGAIAGRIGLHKEFELSDYFPKAKLFVYVQQDINDRKNPNGWSFAVAHVSNLKSQILAANLVDVPNKDVKNVKPVFMDMLKEEGFLHHLNVAHIDEMTDESLGEVIDVIVNEFMKKLGGTGESVPAPAVS